MHRFVQKVGLLPEMFKSLVESTSPQVVNKSQIEYQVKIIASQAKDISDLQSVIENHRNTDSSQATIISTQKLKIKSLEKDIETKTKQLKQQSSELNKLRILKLRESKHLSEKRQSVKDKSLIISDLTSKIATLSSRNNSLNEKAKKLR